MHRYVFKAKRKRPLIRSLAFRYAYLSLMEYILPMTYFSYHVHISSLQFSQEISQRVMITSVDSKLHIFDGIDIIHRYRGREFFWDCCSKNLFLTVHLSILFSVDIVHLYRGGEFTSLSWDCWSEKHVVTICHSIRVLTYLQH